MSLLEGYRLFTGYYIYESEQLLPEAKLEFIRFLKEASADDIIDILSGQYEGVEGLTEEEMEAVNDFIEEKYGMTTAKKALAKIKTLPGKAGAKAKDAAFDARFAARAAKKRVPHKVKGAARTAGEKTVSAAKATKGAAVAASKKPAVRYAAAGVGGAAAGAGGAVGYQKMKKK
jgi:hypothetical protein